MGRGPFAVRAICPDCLTRFTPWKGDPFFLDFMVCPHCGAHKDDFKLKIESWESHSVWWKPSTWGDGRWVRP